MRYWSDHIKGYLLGLVIILAACSRDDMTVEGGTDGYTPLQIGNITFSGVSTRSSDTELTAGDIGVFRLESTGYAATRSNVHYTGSAGEWDIADGGTPIYLTENEATLCAYYPYSSDYADGTVPLTSQLYTSDQNLCYQTGVTAASGTPVSFTLDHAYAKLTFTLTHNAAYSGTCAVSGISIANDGILTSNTLDMTTGSYGSGTAGTVTVDPEISSISSGSSVTVTVLMVPTVSTLSGDITLTFTVDGKEMTTTVDVDDAGLTSLEAGKNYVINSNVSIETANCYIVAPEASLTIPVNVKGNGNADAVAGTDLDVTHTASSVGILWETSSDLVTLSDFSSSNQTVTITASSSTGNAVIAAYDEDGKTILWSWHIWVTDYNPDDDGTTYTITNTAGTFYTFMDRNLGATTSTSGDVGVKGLFYQWGRKDPFPGSTTLDGTTEPTLEGTITAVTKTQVSASSNLANSILYPGTFYYGTSDNTYDWYSVTASTHNDALWGGASTSAPTDKTIFDPCPAGWRVAPWSGGYSPWSAIGANGVSTGSVGTFANYGVTWSVITAGFWPAAGHRLSSSGAFASVGSIGYCWSASPYSSNGYYLDFSSGNVNPSSYGATRAYGFSVRCVRE